MRIKPILLIMFSFGLIIGSRIEGSIVSIPFQFYIGAFGGAGCANDSNIRQEGIAFFIPELSVDAQGPAGRHSIAMGGLHIGCEWRSLLCRSLGLGLAPGVELEGYYLKNLGNAQTSDLINPTDRLPEHDFIDTLPMHCGVFLANVIFKLHTPIFLQPYLGAGIGGTKTGISGADSKQIHPPELNVNHFNSDRDASKWTFIAQAKAGLRFRLSSKWRLFAEYRFLYLCPTNYTFGSTVNPDHVSTTDWHLHLNGLCNNLGVVGLEYCL